MSDDIKDTAKDMADQFRRAAIAIEKLGQLSAALSELTQEQQIEALGRCIDVVRGMQGAQN